MTEVFRCLAGSRLFGTATETSDHDYKAVVLPSAREVLLGKAFFARQNSTGDKTTRNSANDVDVTSTSLHKYVTQLTKMETNAIEMLFAPALPSGTAVPVNPVAMLRENRFKVLSANKDCFLGFGRSQANRYAVRGERKTSLETLCRMLEQWPHGERLGDTNVPNTLRMGVVPGVEVVAKPQPGGAMLDFVSAFGREMPVTCKVGEALKVFEKPLKELGNRTVAAAENGGADWKGLYHAQRIVDEGLELFRTGGLRFPCGNAEYYLNVRAGVFKLEYVLDNFERSLLELENLSPIPEFSEQPDLDWAEEFVSAFHEQIVVGAYEKWRAAA